MRYPIAIEPGTPTTAFGVVVPDLPGCFSAGDTLDEAIANAKEAILAWIGVTVEDGELPPRPTNLGAVREQPEFAGWTFAVIDIP